MFENIKELLSHKFLKIDAIVPNYDQFRQLKKAKALILYKNKVLEQIAQYNRDEENVYSFYDFVNERTNEQQNKLQQQQIFKLIEQQFEDKKVSDLQFMKLCAEQFSIQIELLNQQLIVLAEILSNKVQDRQQKNEDVKGQQDKFEEEIKNNKKSGDQGGEKIKKEMNNQKQKMGPTFEYLKKIYFDKKYLFDEKEGFMTQTQIIFLKTFMDTADKNILDQLANLFFELNKKSRQPIQNQNAVLQEMIQNMKLTEQQQKDIIEQLDQNLTNIQKENKKRVDALDAKLQEYIDGKTTFEKTLQERDIIYVNLQQDYQDKQKQFDEQIKKLQLQMEQKELNFNIELKNVQSKYKDYVINEKTIQELNERIRSNQEIFDKDKSGVMEELRNFRILLQSKVDLSELQNIQKIHDDKMKECLQEKLLYLEKSKQQKQDIFILIFDKIKKDYQIEFSEEDKSIFFANILLGQEKQEDILSKIFIQIKQFYETLLQNSDQSSEYEKKLNIIKLQLEQQQKIVQQDIEQKQKDLQNLQNVFQKIYGTEISLAGNIENFLNNMQQSISLQGIQLITKKQLDEQISQYLKTIQLKDILVEELNQQIKQLKLASIQQSFVEEQLKSQKLQKRLDEVEIQLEGYKKTMDELLIQIQNSTSYQSGYSLVEQIKYFNRQFQVLNQQKAALEQQINESHQINNQKIMQYESNVVILKNQISTLNSEAQNFKIQLEDQVRENQRLQQRFTQDYENYKNQQANLENRLINENNNNIEQMNQQNKQKIFEYELKLKNNESLILQNNNQIQILQQKQNEAQNDYMQKLSQLQIIKNEKEILQQIYDDKSEELKRLINNHANLKSKFDEMQLKYHQLDSEYQKNQFEIKKMQQQLENKIIIEGDNKSYEEKMKNLLIKQNDFIEQNRILLLEKQDRQEKITQMAREIQNGLDKLREQMKINEENQIIFQSYKVTMEEKNQSLNSLVNSLKQEMQRLGINTQDLERLTQKYNETERLLQIEKNKLYEINKELLIQQQKYQDQLSINTKQQEQIDKLKLENQQFLNKIKYLEEQISNNKNVYQQEMEQLQKQVKDMDSSINQTTIRLQKIQTLKTTLLSQINQMSLAQDSTQFDYHYQEFKQNFKQIIIFNDNNSITIIIQNFVLIQRNERYIDDLQNMIMSNQELVSFTQIQINYRLNTVERDVLKNQQQNNIQQLQENQRIINEQSLKISELQQQLDGQQKIIEKNQKQIFDLENQQVLFAKTKQEFIQKQLDQENQIQQNTQNFQNEQKLYMQKIGQIESQYYDINQKYQAVQQQNNILSDNQSQQVQSLVGSNDTLTKQNIELQNQIFQNQQQNEKNRQVYEQNNQIFNQQSGELQQVKLVIQQQQETIVQSKMQQQQYLYENNQYQQEMQRLTIKIKADSQNYRDMQQEIHELNKFMRNLSNFQERVPKNDRLLDENLIQQERKLNAELKRHVQNFEIRRYEALQSRSQAVLQMLQYKQMDFNAIPLEIVYLEPPILKMFVDKNKLLQFDQNRIQIIALINKWYQIFVQNVQEIQYNYLRYNKYFFYYYHNPISDNVYQQMTIEEFRSFKISDESLRLFEFQYYQSPLFYFTQMEHHLDNYGTYQNVYYQLYQGCDLGNLSELQISYNILPQNVFMNLQMHNQNVTQKETNKEIIQNQQKEVEIKKVVEQKQKQIEQQSSITPGINAPLNEYDSTPGINDRDILEFANYNKTIGEIKQTEDMYQEYNPEDFAFSDIEKEIEEFQDYPMDEKEKIEIGNQLKEFQVMYVKNKQQDSEQLKQKLYKQGQQDGLQILDQQQQQIKNQQIQFVRNQQYEQQEEDKFEDMQIINQKKWQDYSDINNPIYEQQYQKIYQEVQQEKQMVIQMKSTEELFQDFVQASQLKGSNVDNRLINYMKNRKNKQLQQNVKQINKQLDQLGENQSKGVQGDDVDDSPYKFPSVQKNSILKQKAVIDNKKKEIIQKVRQKQQEQHNLKMGQFQQLNLMLKKQGDQQIQQLNKQMDQNQQQMNQK